MIAKNKIARLIFNCKKKKESEINNAEYANKIILVFLCPNPNLNNA